MESENDSTNTAGSPVLGSSTFKRRFVRTKGNRKNAKLKLSDKFDNESVTSDGNQKDSNSENGESEIDKNKELIKQSRENSNIISNNNRTVGFQTASGKPISSSRNSSNFAKSLMCEILNPLLETNRENKYNFLSKNPIDKTKVHAPIEYIVISKCPGFEIEEYRFSLERYERLKSYINIVNGEVNWETGIPLQETCNTPKFKFDTAIPFETGNKNYNTDGISECKKTNVAVLDSENMFSKIEGIDNDTEKQRKSEVKSVGSYPNSSQIKNAFDGIESSMSIKKHTSYMLDRETDAENQIFVAHNNNESSIIEEMKSMNNFFGDIENKTNSSKKTEEECVPQFTTATGRKISICSSSISRSRSIFHDIPDIKIDETVFQSNTNTNISNFEQKTIIPKMETPQFTTASGKRIKLSPNKLSKIHSVFKDITDLNICDYIEKIPENSMKKECESTEINSFQSTEKCDKNIASLFSTASGKTIKLPSSSLQGVNKIFQDIPEFNDIKTKLEDNEYFGCDKEMKNKERNDIFRLKNNEMKDISNISSSEKNCFTEDTHTPLKNKIPHIEEKLKQTNMSKMNENKDNTNYVTPQRSLPSRRKLGVSSSNGKISDAALNRAKSLFGDLNFDDLKLPSHLKISSPQVASESFSTPIKPNKFQTPRFSSTPVRLTKKNDSFLYEMPQEHNHPFLIQKPTAGSLKDVDEELNRQKEILEKKMEFVMKKQEAIRMQIQAQTSNKRCKLEQQEKRNKINLMDVKNLEMQSDYRENINSIILQINPQNAVLIHFNNNWYEVPTVTTEDGCTLVPNAHGLVGISEIEPAFASMPDIEKNLIPEGWIKNHYRWIIWKLASYERCFPATLGGCFNVHNVIKQLKYRYLREIHNAERPALRKIYEKDDVPQKRMVLCISNIIKNGEDTELELTDGWYSIRTMIDDLLCRQVNKQKIKIGSKLIISGAEVLNCEGCHPLEVEQARKVRLKIYFNSTKRACWSSKLGYQKDPSPLPIKLSTAVWNGGNIGSITVYIVRVYPVIYREKLESSVLWRNQNAEYKKVQEFENECMKKYEEGDNVNIMRRNVCPLLQMTVIDSSETDVKPFKCIIWDSTELHQEQLRENQIVTFYNLTLRSNGELSCNKKSYFQVLKHDTAKYEKYRRKCVELSSYEIMSNIAIFGEFDTAGFLIKISVEENSQHFWLTDLNNNFLLVKVAEGPSNCLLLNKVEENDLVAVCNLTLKGNSGAYVVASASFQTIVTQYPQYNFLRKKIEEMGKQDKNDILRKLEENRRTVDNFESGNIPEQTSHSSASEGNTLNFSRVTSTDAVMSMINIDEIVSKHQM